MSNFESKKAEILKKVEELAKEYEGFTELVSPKFWRSSGSHFSTLRRMANDIPRYTKITEEEAKSEINLQNYKDNMPDNHSIGSWDCTHSPIGTCVYDYVADPCEDDCIYCGQPDERK
jgi:hypothetical protein